MCICILYNIHYTVYTRALYGNFKVYIMRTSYDSIDNKLKQKMCGKVNKDITFIQFFHSTPLHSTELFKIFFSLLTLQLLFCKKRVGREKIPFIIVRSILLINIEIECCVRWLAATVGPRTFLQLMRVIH